MSLTRMLVVGTSLWLLAWAPSVWSEDEGYIADSNGCKIANPSPRPNESVTWSGQCKDGFAEGEGVMQWTEDGQPGVHYEGALVHGVLSGQGKLSMPNGTTYEGGWLDGQQNGQGVLSSADGGSYKGEWKNGKPDGHGVVRNASGDSVEGDWKDGVYQAPAKQQ